MSLTYAIADIHGSLRKLRGLIARCGEHAGGRSTTFVFLGDYIDRGPESAGVVSYLIDLQSSQREHVIALKGNHEAFALGVMEGVTDADH
jgi:calcineurin-like phosphoesterase family protein